MTTRKTISIAGLDKAEVLAALFNNSRQLGMGVLQTAGRHAMSVDDARKIISVHGLYFDYLLGRVLKVHLEVDDLYTGLYDRDIGEGAAERVIAGLREKATP